MTDLHVPDLSEHQPSVDMARIGPAVILRAHNGYRADHTFAARLAQAREHVKARAFYLYLLADHDAAAQAHAAAAVIGKVQPGEAVVVDLEEGTGNQAPRFEAAAAILRKETGAPVGLYSGLSFDADHLAAAKPDFLWIAAYRSTEPSVHHDLWQHTDHETHAGVGSPCDCSIFHGTADQLLALWGGKAPAKKATKPPTKPEPLPPHPSWWTHTVRHLEHDQSIASALKVWNDPAHPMQVTNSDSVAHLFAAIQRSIGEPPTGALTLRTAVAIQHKADGKPW